MATKKILIIDDDIDLVEAMRLTLESADFEVIDAQDGKKGLEKVSTNSPDLVILDVMMGTQDEGFHVAYQIRNNSETSDIPLIMLTALGLSLPLIQEPRRFSIPPNTSLKISSARRSVTQKMRRRAFSSTDRGSLPWMADRSNFNSA